MSEQEAKRKEEFRELIDRHIDAGTCYLCGKPVADGEPRHSVTGSHWDCMQDLKVATQPPKPDTNETRLHALARANGGFLIHVVDRENGVALCGHAPKSRTRMSRAGWKWCRSVPTGFTLCRKCGDKRDQLPARDVSS